MSKSKLEENALNYHSLPTPGKIEVIPTKPCKKQQDLSLAYTPGVAVPCLEIKNNPEKAYKYTSKGNLVAVLTNGTAVLGLGNIGALAGKPVMEGKGVLFKCFADIDVFDIEIDTLNTDELINTCKLLEPTFGGINLEDIKAPECFIIEEELKKTMNIPVFHDDQHGTAIIGSAALINGLKIVNKNISEVKVVINGAGASGLAVGGLFLSMGVKKENLTVCDTRGVIYKGRQEGMNKYKEKFAVETDKRTLAEVAYGCDVLFGLSKKGVFTEEIIKNMAQNPLIMAMANPDPEITPEEVYKIRKDAIMATGRSDYPNQVNNVLCFPFMFRGALDVKAKAINEEMKIAAAYAIAELAREEVPESVCRAYGVSKLEFGKNYILPKPFDPRVFTRVSAAVAKAAMDSGVAAKPIKDFDEYKASLEERLNPSKIFLHSAVKKAKSSDKKIKIGFSYGEKPSVISAAISFLKTGAGEPVLIGSNTEIKNAADSAGFDIRGITIIDPEKFKHSKKFIKDYYEQNWKNGITQDDAYKIVKCPNLFGSALLYDEEIDGLVAFANKSYQKTADAICEIIDIKHDFYGISYAALLANKERKLIIADTITVGDDSGDLCDISLQTASTAELLGIEPKIAIVNNSYFGSPDTAESERARYAVQAVKSESPKLIIDGDMALDMAINPEIAAKYPLSEIKGNANILVFTESSAADATAKCLINAAGYRMAGIVTQGFDMPVQIALKDIDSEDIVTLAAIAAAAAVKKKSRKKGK